MCSLLGIQKLNTTAYHPKCDSKVERFNGTLKSMMYKRVSQFGAQWDKDLSAILCAYRNTPHETTGEKPSFLLFGWDCRLPTEAAFLRAEDVTLMSVSEYREELMLNLSLARKSALENVHRSQIRYKKYYIRRLMSTSRRLETVCLFIFQVRKLENKGNCHDPGMDLTGSPLAMKLMLRL